MASPGLSCPLPSPLLPCPVSLTPCPLRPTPFLCRSAHFPKAERKGGSSPPTTAGTICTDRVRSWPRPSALLHPLAGHPQTAPFLSYPRTRGVCRGHSPPPPFSHLEGPDSSILRPEAPTAAKVGRDLPWSLLNRPQLLALTAQGATGTAGRPSCRNCHQSRPFRMDVYGSHQLCTCSSRTTGHPVACATEAAAV